MGDEKPIPVPLTDLEDAQAYVIVASRVLDELEALRSAELGTLRGIAKRLADGWRNHWEMQTHEHVWLYKLLDGTRETEPMTEAEVHAIYGTEESTEK